MDLAGDLRNYVSLKFPVFGDDGQVIATGGVATDITAQKRQTERATDREQSVTLDLPAPPVPVDGDPHRLEQIAVNLLTNAARYSASGSETIVKVLLHGGEAVLEVQDAGRGIERDHLERIFGLFDRGGEVGGKAGGGLGVGLTLARQLAELHGGSLTAASAGPGMGSTFTLKLPATDAPPPPGRDDRGVPALPPCRVRVVDDNHDLARSVGAFLESQGHTVRVEHDGADAPGAARAFRPDLVLLDLGLPGLTGWEVASLSPCAV